MATLFIFAGQPGTGKSTLAARLAGHLQAAHVRIDTIEQALRDLCEWTVVAEGYRLAYRIAADNLRAGVGVVADSCNPIELSRREWRGVARDAGAGSVDIEVTCSDPIEHRRRVETRGSSIPGLRLPAWSDVETRECHPWSTPRVRVDTAGVSEEQSFDALLAGLRDAKWDIPTRRPA